jgi:ABC-type uncharacterized transport system substrate-binding protein
MDDISNKPSLKKIIQTLYQPVFLIYALSYLITNILSFLGFVKLSWILWFLLPTVILFLGFTILGLLKFFIWKNVSFSSRLENITNRFFFHSPKFVIFVGFFSLFSLIGLIYYYHTVIKATKTTIAVLLPLSMNVEGKANVIKDGERQFLGIKEYLAENNIIEDNIEIKILDHQLSTERTQELVDIELEKGTKYFLCTMTNVSTWLAGYLKEKKSDAVLICTVTSYYNKSAGNELNLSPNQTYRLYIRSDIEARTLSSFVKPESHVVCIYPPSDRYSNNCFGQFNIEMKKKKIEVTEITLTNSNDFELIFRKESDALKMANVVYVADYGENAGKMVELLIEKFTNKDTQLLVTSTLGDQMERKIKESDKPTKELSATQNEFENIIENIESQQFPVTKIPNTNLENFRNDIVKQLKGESSLISGRVDKLLYKGIKYHYCKPDFQDSNADIMTVFTQLSLRCLVNTVNDYNNQGILKSEKFDTFWRKNLEALPEYGRGKIRSEKADVIVQLKTN